MSDQNRISLVNSQSNIVIAYHKGTDLEIGAQHASLLGEQNSNSNLGLFFASMVKGVVRPKPPEFETGVARLMRSGYSYWAQKFLVKPMMARFPGWARDRLRGLCEAKGIDLKEVLRGYTMPDLFPYLSGLQMRMLPYGSSQTVFQTFGCSSFVNDGERFLIGRNLDFPGTGVFDRQPFVGIYERPGCLKYMGVSCLSTPFAGVTGINESKIYVALHQHYTKSVSRSGVSPYFISEEILARATSIDEAMQILSRHQTYTGWGFVIVDGKTRESIIYEKGPHEAGFRYLKPHSYLAHTNFFHTKSCQPSEYASSYAHNWDLHGRYRQLERALVRTGRGLDVAEACQILSDPTDGATGLETIGHRKISANHVIQSLVLDPIEMKVWVNDGSPPHLTGSFQGIDIAKLFEGKKDEAILKESYNSLSYTDPQMSIARQYLIQSFSSYLSGNMDLALREIRESCQCHETPENLMILGILEFKRYGIKIAAECFEKSIALSEKHVVLGPISELKTPENLEAKLWLARAYIEIGRETDAERIFQDLAKAPQLAGDPMARIASLQLPITTKFLEEYVPPYAIFTPIR